MKSLDCPEMLSKIHIILIKNDPDDEAQSS